MPTGGLKSQLSTESNPKGKQKSDSKQHAKQTQIVMVTECDEELTFVQRYQHRLKSLNAAGYGISVIVHLFLLIVLSIFYVKHSTLQEPPLVSIFTTEENSLDVLELIDVRIELESETQSSILPELLAQNAVNMKPILSVFETDNDDIIGDTVGIVIGDKIGFPRPSGGRTVTQGSFTAWTITADPKPRQDYLVVIQIILPEKIKQYRKEDLTGFLTGDDGYKTPIGSYRGSKYSKKYYGHFDLKANQFFIKIPGAAAKVQDTINIQSRMLKEKQVLVIVF